MISKTRMLELIKNLCAKEVAAGLAENPALLKFRDERGRNWLHLCCGVNPRTRRLEPGDAVKTARVLLDAGLELNREAFREGNWKATPPPASGSWRISCARRARPRSRGRSGSARGRRA